MFDNGCISRASYMCPHMQQKMFISLSYYIEEMKRGRRGQRERRDGEREKGTGRKKEWKGGRKGQGEMG